MHQNISVFRFDCSKIIGNTDTSHQHSKQIKFFTKRSFGNL